MKWTVGIDEVGRGPIAGPVAVGVIKIPESFNMDELTDVRDSKKHTEKQRNAIYEYLVEKKKAGELDFAVCMTDAERIDEEGIVISIQSALCCGLKELSVDPNESKILLDGGLKAPSVFKHQETIIKGDSKERAISFASIVAKVERDKLMAEFGGRFPGYELEKNKGYGTKAHMEAVKTKGLTLIHRKSFIHLSK